MLVGLLTLSFAAKRTQRVVTPFGALRCCLRLIPSDLVEVGYSQDLSRFNKIKSIENVYNLINAISI